MAQAHGGGLTGASYQWSFGGITRGTVTENGDTLSIAWDPKPDGPTDPNNRGPADQLVQLTITPSGGGHDPITQDYWFYYDFDFDSDTPVGSYNPSDLTLDPAALRPGTTTVPANNAGLDLITGGLSTGVALPSYNPQLGPTSLVYHSELAAPKPIFSSSHTYATTTLEVSARVTFDGTSTTNTYDSSEMIQGSVAQLGVQANASAKPTGRYDYTMDFDPDGPGGSNGFGSPVSGTTTVIDGGDNPFGLPEGWWISGFATLHAASGGVIWNYGDGRSSWFASKPGGGYTSPAMSYGTLEDVSGGGYRYVDSDGVKTTSFNSDGLPTSATDAAGRTTTLHYSGGVLRSIQDPYVIQDPNNSSNSFIFLTTFTYTGSGSNRRLATVEDPAGRVLTVSYSGGVLKSIELPSGAGAVDDVLWEYGYNADGLLDRITDPEGHTTTYHYDQSDRVATVTYPEMKADGSGFIETTLESYQVRTLGVGSGQASALLLAQAYGIATGATGQPMAQSLDWDGFGTGPQFYMGDCRYQSSSSAPGTGLPSASTDPSGFLSSYQYNAQGRLTQVVNPDFSMVKFSYDSTGTRLTGITDENGNQITFTYHSGTNGFGKFLKTIESPDGDGDGSPDITSFTYNGTGMLRTVTDAENRVTTFDYDNVDRLVKITHPDTSAVTSVVYEYGGTTTQPYVDASNIQSITDERGVTIDFDYDPLDRVRAIHEPTESGLASGSTTFTYDLNGNVTLVQRPLNQQVAYDYDKLDQPTTVTVDLDSTRQAVTNYVYDDAGRLVSVVDPLNRVVTMAYSPRGDLESVTRNVGLNGGPIELSTVTFSYDPRGLIQRISGPLENQESSFDFDSRGNLVSSTNAEGESVRFQYDPGRRLTQIIDPGGDTTTFSYDGKDQVTVVNEPLSRSTTYGYDAVGNLVSLTDPNNIETTLIYPTQLGPENRPDRRPRDPTHPLYLRRDRAGRIHLSVGDSRVLDVPASHGNDLRQPGSAAYHDPPRGSQPVKRQIDPLCLRRR